MRFARVLYGCRIDQVGEVVSMQRELKVVRAVGLYFGPYLQTKAGPYSYSLRFFDGEVLEYEAHEIEKVQRLS